MCWPWPAATASPPARPSERSAADQVVAALSSRAWNRYSAGDGAKGLREYDWAWMAITPPDDEATGHHWLLVRRSLSDGELAFYRCWSPHPVGLPTLVRVAGTRWCIETCFQTGKGAVGSTSTRSAAGTPGTGIRHWSCSPTPCSP